MHTLLYSKWITNKDLLYSTWNSPDQNTGVGSRSLLQGIFPTKGLNPGLPHCKQILYQLSHNRNPRILEWIAYPFTSRSSRPRNQTGVLCTTGGFFTNWAIREVTSTWTLLNVMCQTGWDGVWGRMDTCTCMAEFFHCSPETTTTLLIGYTSIQNKKFKV